MPEDMLNLDVETQHIDKLGLTQMSAIMMPHGLEYRKVQ